MAKSDELCAANGAEPARVLAAADAAGWAMADDRSSEVLDMFDMQADPNGRALKVGADTLLLNVRETRRATPAGAILVRDCRVTNDGPGAAGLQADVERRFGGAALRTGASPAAWLYVGDGAARRFLPDTQAAQAAELKAGRTVVRAAIFHDRDMVGLSYQTWTLAPGG